MSSAYIRQWIAVLFTYTGSGAEWKYFGRSLINILNKLGLRLSPCFTPILIGKNSVRLFPTLIQDLLDAYRFLTML